MVRRAPHLRSGRRLAVATTVVVLAIVFGGAGLTQPVELRPIDGWNLASTHNAAITEATALDSTFTERRTSQRSDLFLLAVVLAGVAWVLPRPEEPLEDSVSVRVSFGRPLLVRERGPPCFS